LTLSDGTLTRLMAQLCGNWNQVDDPTKEAEAKPMKIDDHDDLPF
jgi:hypothetical protein